MEQKIFLRGDVLKDYIVKNRMTESEFALKIGVAHSTVNRVLNRKRNPGGKFISGVLTEFEDLTFDKVFIFNINLPKGNLEATPN